MAYYKKLYTDYPFTKLGDKEGQEAPLREIEVLEYDGNKYCRILVDGIEEWIKSGYIYKSPEYKLVRFSFTRMPYKEYPLFDIERHFMNNKEYAEYRKNKRKRKIFYHLFTHSKGGSREFREFKSLRKAINTLSSLSSSYKRSFISKYEKTYTGFNVHYGTILSFKDG